MVAVETGYVDVTEILYEFYEFSQSAYGTKND